MSTFVALLRGVNVGSAKRIPMAVLRKILTELGFTGVSTLLNSGNVVFSAGKAAPAKHAAAIAAAISRELRVEVPVLVKSAADLAFIVAECPFKRLALNPSRLFVAFAADSQALARLAPIGALAAPPEQFVVGRHAVYLHCPDGVLKSKAGEALLAKVGPAVTTRNWATVQKLHAMAGGGDA